MRLQKLHDWRVLSVAIYRVLCWMLLSLLLSLMLRNTATSIEGNWARGPLHPSPISHTMPEEDFAVFWQAARLARAGDLRTLYAPPLFAAWKRQHFGPGLLQENWLNPPTALLIVAPFSLIPLAPAFVLWDAASLAAAVALLRWARLPWPILLVGLAGPATWRCLALGQYGLILGALTVAGLWLAPRAPLRAGLMLSLLTLKPQQSLVVPVAWLAARNRRALTAAAAAFASLVAATLLWPGPRSWTAFVTQASVTARLVLNAPPPQPYINTGVSMFWMLRTFGSGIAFANLAQLAAALAALALTYRAWRRPDADPRARVGATACLSLLVTPYGYTSDMVAYSLAVATVFAANRYRLGLLDILLWTWPFFCTVVTIRTGLLLTPLLVTGAAVRCWRRMDPATASPPRSP